MAYTLPAFPMQALIWHAYDPSITVYASPDASIDCNLTPGRRIMVSDGQMWYTVTPYSVYWTPMQLLVPALTDIRCPEDTGTAIPDLIECPKASGRIYLVSYVDDIAKGFANEHRFAMMHRMAQKTIFADTAIPIPVPLP